MANNESGTKMAQAPETHNILEETLASSGSKFSMKRVAVIVGGLVLIVIATYAMQQATTTKQMAADKVKAEHAPVPVTVAKAEVQPVPLEIHNIGNVMPYSVVNVIAQVGGQLSKVNFKQGDYVKAGDLLFQIDPRPFQASLDQAQGNAAKDRAQIAVAKANLARDTAAYQSSQANLTKDTATEKLNKVEADRYQTLAKQGAVSEEQFDQERTAYETILATLASDKANEQNSLAVMAADKANILSAEATLASDEGAVENAKLNLSFTQIRSPINGRTGALNVYQGNIVVANANTPLVSIMQVEPIYATFSVPEKELPGIRQAEAAGILKVEALLEGNGKNRVTGTLTFVNNTVDTTTGTIALRGTFPNSDLKMWPGEFVNIVLTLSAAQPALVIPSQAVQTGQDGTAVFVVSADNTVSYKPIVVLRTYRDKSVISSGLNAGDTVVTDGQLQLSPGSAIKISNYFQKQGK